MNPNSQNKGEEAARERLDVPSQASIERKLLVRNDAPTTKPTISQPQPNGDLLSRLQTFLPQMEEANKNLNAEETARQARFEDPEEDEGPVVELDLACGVFDLKDETAIDAAERSLINQGITVETFSGGSSDSSSSSSSSSSESENEEIDSEDNEDAQIDEDEAGPSAGDKKLKNKGRKKPPSRHHPGIQELS